VRIFGCRANVRVAKPHLKKLDDRSKPMVYLGVEDGSKAHRLYDPQTKRIAVSRDVVFEEAIPWEWDSVYTEGSEFDVEDVMDGITYTLGINGGYEDDPDANQNGGEAAGSRGPQPTEDGAGGSGNNATEMQFDVVHDQIMEAEAPEGSGGNQEQFEMDLDDTIDQDDDGPVRFRSINDVYHDSVEVDLASDAEVEVLLAVMEEPAKYQDAVGNEDWMAAMDSEIQSINKNQTWQLAKLPAGHKPIGLKWVYKLKKNAEGEVVKHKARLVAKGYVQKKVLIMKKYLHLWPDLIQ
jgi:hypothetical protein